MNPPNQPTLAQLREAFEALTKQGAYIIGSFGRAALYEYFGEKPDMEFEQRGENMLVKPNGIPRDIDFIGRREIIRQFRRRFAYPFDPTAFCNQGFEIVPRKGKRTGWEFNNFRHGSTTPLEAEIFQPVEATICDVPCRTLRPATHFVLLNMPSLRFQDQLALGCLASIITPEELTFLRSSAYDPLRWHLGQGSMRFL